MGPVVNRDVTTTEFPERVVARSRTVPVVVDFWATWCQPCRVLSPTLERLERAANGAWELMKVDIDRERILAEQFRITSIPALKGFRDGQVVAEMLGAQPESAVRAFLAGLHSLRSGSPVRRGPGGPAGGFAGDGGEGPPRRDCG